MKIFEKHIRIGNSIFPSVKDLIVGLAFFFAIFGFSDGLIYFTENIKGFPGWALALISLALIWLTFDYTKADEKKDKNDNKSEI